VNKARRYLVDSSIFINAVRTYYAFDLAPKFWTLLETHIQDGRVISIDKVKAELMDGDDELSRWAETRSHMFHPTKNNEILAHYGFLQRWAHQSSQYNSAAKAEFAADRNADPWLVAWSMESKDVLVTFESQTNKDIQKRIPIPNVCRAFGVEFSQLFQMMRELKIVID
jgi:hypothetical protein